MPTLTERSPDSLSFKHCGYRFVEDIVLPLAESYVPDWDLEKAVKESLQNAYDEAWISKAETHIAEEEDAVYLRDSGRGVHYSAILVIGDSGKRDQIGVVGTHGEGEIISFLVSARLGIRKWMCSQNWLLEGRIGVNEFGKNVLILARYETQSGKPRKGTRWYYSMPGTYAYEIKRAFTRAQEDFANHAAVTKTPKRAFRGYGDRQWLFTNGQKVVQDYRLVLGYNLLLHPGRDRSVFSLSDARVRNEIETILENDATSDDLETILHEGRYGTSKIEFELDCAEMDTKTVKKALSSLKKDGYDLCWARNDSDAAQIADAVERGTVSILRFDAGVPTWVRNAVPHVSSKVKSFAKEDTKKRMPKDFAQAVDLLLKEIYHENAKVEMHNPLPEGVIADANCKTSTIRFDWKKSKEMSITTLFETLGHELAHIVSCAEDCTRAHNSAMGMLMSLAAQNLVQDPKASKAWRMAETRIKRYNGRGE